MTTGILYQVLLPYATFGIIGNSDTIVDSAPIGKWMIGKKISYIQTWVKNKKGTIIEVKEGRK